MSAASNLSQAPLEFQQLIWFCSACQILSNVCWVTHYACMLRTSLKQQTYCMPVLVLCNNLAWEITYAFIFPFDDGGSADEARYLHYVGFALNLFVTYLTIKHGMAREWSHAPLVQRNLPWLFALGVAGFLAAQVSFAKQFGLDHSQQFSGCASQLFLSVACLCQLLSRGSLRGTSYVLW